MKSQLLIHSMFELFPIISPILEVANVKNICEIGAEEGGNSKILCEWAQRKNGTLYSIDPKPSDGFLAWLPKVSPTVKYIANYSLAAIPDLPAVDAYFIDGDHNWYTVYHELIAIRELSRKQNRPMLVFLHDVSWPCGRRDFYYSPHQIPEKYRQPYTWEEGVELDNLGTIKGGFRGEGSFAVAIHEGGERNGVLTAINDFTKEFSKEFCFAHVPAIFGLGVLFDFAHPQANIIATLLAPYHNNLILQTMESNRLLNYLTVIKWQDRAAQDKKHLENMPPSTPDEVTITGNTEVSYEKFEKRAVIWINVLSDEKNHPEIWQQIYQQQKANSQYFNNFVDYLVLLSAIPQDPIIMKIISVIHAICLLENGDRDSALAKLSGLISSHPQCELVRGAHNHISQRTPALS
jgi:hypothetical protein